MPTLHPSRHEPPPAPHRHSGAGRNPEPRLAPAWRWAGVWIPAFAGMTMGLCGFIWGWRQNGVGVHGRAPLPRITKPNQPPNKKPSPSGRGLGEGESLSARHRHTLPPNPTVIPAKAGIHTPAYRYAAAIPGFWIPACAGMTVGAGAALAVGPGVS